MREQLVFERRLLRQQRIDRRAVVHRACGDEAVNTFERERDAASLEEHQDVAASTVCGDLHR